MKIENSRLTPESTETGHTELISVALNGPTRLVLRKYQSDGAHEVAYYIWVRRGYKRRVVHLHTCRSRSAADKAMKRWCEFFGVASPGSSRENFPSSTLHPQFLNLLELPHTAGCLVCGRDNPHGLQLSSNVDLSTGNVQTIFTPQAHHIGFENLIHGGVLATVADEIMVWAAIWASGRGCVAAELSLRYKNKASVGRELVARATVTQNRSRLIETSAEIIDGSILICSATAKYAPLGKNQTASFLKTLVIDPSTMESTSQLWEKFVVRDR